MRGFVSIVASACFAMFVAVSILSGPLYRVHPVGHGNVVLAPAGDDGIGGH